MSDVGCFSHLMDEPLLKLCTLVFICIVSTRHDIVGDMYTGVSGVGESVWGVSRVCVCERGSVFV